MLVVIMEVDRRQMLKSVLAYLALPALPNLTESLAILPDSLSSATTNRLLERLFTIRNSSEVELARLVTQSYLPALTRKSPTQFVIDMTNNDPENTYQRTLLDEFSKLPAINSMGNKRNGQTITSFLRFVDERKKFLQSLGEEYRGILKELYTRTEEYSEDIPLEWFEFTRFSVDAEDIAQALHYLKCFSKGTMSEFVQQQDSPLSEVLDIKRTLGEDYKAVDADEFDSKFFANKLRDEIDDNEYTVFEHVTPEMYMFSIALPGFETEALEELEVRSHELQDIISEIDPRTSTHLYLPSHGKFSRDGIAYNSSADQGRLYIIEPNDRIAKVLSDK